MITQEDNQAAPIRALPTLTMADLPALDDSEWEQIEIGHPMSNELVDHLLDKLKPETVEVA